MKFITSIMLTLGTGAALMSAAVSPVNAEKKEVATVNNTQQVAQAAKMQDFSGAVRVIVPQKDLETAIRSSEKGDILLLGPEGWYRVEGKNLQQGTKMYVLGGHSSMVSAFPKEAETVR